MHDVFVSHAQSDGAHAKVIASSLREQGWSVFVASEAIRPGERYPDRLDDEIRRCKAVVALWSTTAFRSEWVTNECATAIARDVLIPVLIEPVERVPLQFIARHHIDLTDTNDFVRSRCWHQLLDAISTLVAAPDPPQESSVNQVADAARAHYTTNTPRFHPRRRLAVAGVAALGVTGVLNVMQASGSAQGTFELYPDRSGELRFRLRDADGTVLLHSEGYKSREGALNGIASIRENALLTIRFKRETASDGTHYFNLLAGNHQVIGTSSRHATPTARDHAIQRVAAGAPKADLIDTP